MDPPFPTDVQEFDGDDRISFSKLDNKFIGVHDDGSEFEFDPDTKRWVPAAEDDDDQPPEHDEHDYGGEGPLGSHNTADLPSRKRKDGPEDAAQVSTSSLP